MTDEKELTEGEQILKIIRDAEEKNIVVFWTLDELSGMDLDTMISQPTDGLLYDLNMDKVTCATWIRQDGANGTWVNSYASALVITRLKEKLEEFEHAISKFTGCNHGLDKINSDAEGAWCMRCMDLEHAKVLGECRHCGGKLDENLFCAECKDGYKE